MSTSDILIVVEGEYYKMPSRFKTILVDFLRGVREADEIYARDTKKD